MDERLHFGSEDALRASSSVLNIEHVASTDSLERDTSKLYLQHKNYHLHLVQKREPPIERSIIPASKHERLSFYRNYMASPIKPLVFFSLQIDEFNRFFWIYLSNLLFKTLPHTYVNLFLGSYMPEEHLFVPKMIPFFYGFKFSLVITCYLEIFFYMENICFLFGYIVQGVILKNPWNRCPEKYFYQTDDHKTSCYEIAQFAQMVTNKTWALNEIGYSTSDDEYFQLVQVQYHTYYTLKVHHTYLKICYFLLLCLGVGIAEKCIVKKSIWKFINITQWTILALECIVFFHLIVDAKTEKRILLNHTTDEDLNIFLNGDVGILVESTTAPPVIQILTARSYHEVVPSRDSAAIVISSATQFIFRGLLTSKLKKYCENVIKVPMQLYTRNSAWYHYWTIFFSQFYFGDLYTVAYFAINLVNEVLTILVLYHCFLEVLVWEWRWLKSWMFTMFLATTGVLLYALLPKQESVFLLLIYSKGIVTLAEVFVLYFLYPAGRLVDDVTFHCGSPPNDFRILGIKFMPVYYFIKLYILFDALKTALIKNNYYHHNFVDSYGWSWSLMLIPYILGMVCMSYKYIVKDKAGWQRMFIPDPNWGPRDATIKQLRKEYDSRYYIGSQMLNRELSRYMLQKSEANAFSLDLNYSPDRRSTIPFSQFRKDSIKKNM